MKNIHNKEDLRIAYAIIGIAKQTGNLEHPWVTETKRAIRSYNHLPRQASRLVRDDGMDGYVELIELPEFLNKYEERDVIEWFEERVAHPHFNSMYDCTGRPITNWFKVFRRCGNWFAYHSVSFDV